MKEENEGHKQEENRLWHIHGDYIDKITELNEEIIERNNMLVEVEDQIYKAKDEISEGKIAKNAAEEDLRNMKKEYDKLQRKCLNFKKASCEKDIEIKKKDLEIERLKAQKLKETPKKDSI